ncbi:MAG: hypothetical protein LBR79_02455 [Oscillospiraceae bacterium]|nr:hypothetical protein [Oscillospiraceae bacterium]
MRWHLKCIIFFGCGPKLVDNIFSTHGGVKEGIPTILRYDQDCARV